MELDEDERLLAETQEMIKEIRHHIDAFKEEYEEVEFNDVKLSLDEMTRKDRELRRKSGAYTGK